jgi:hypothetical protein
MLKDRVRNKKELDVAFFRSTILSAGVLFPVCPKAESFELSQYMNSSYKLIPAMDN